MDLTMQPRDTGFGMLINCWPQMLQMMPLRLRYCLPLWRCLLLLWLMMRLL
tara:strand:- start:99 stop:251 length:153 start_codon:yes stop_codon:yes gene_type:complete